MKKINKGSNYISWLRRYLPKKITVNQLLIIGIIGLLAVVLIVVLFRRSSKITVELQITDLSPFYSESKPSTWFARSIKVGDIEKDAIGITYAEVKNLIRYPFDDGQYKDMIFLNVELKTVYNQGQKQHFFKGKPVLIGSTIKLSLNNTQLDGIVVSVPNDKQKAVEKKRIVLAELNYSTFQANSEIFGVMPWIVDGFGVGDTFMDSNNRVLVKILEKNVSPADQLIVTDDGRVMLGEHPIRKKVELKLEVVTEEIQGSEYYLHSFPFRLGSTLPMYLDDISIYPVITKMVE